MAISKRRVRAEESRSRRRQRTRQFNFENLEERRLLAFIPPTPELGIFVEQGGSPTSNGQVTNIEPNNRVNGAIESVLAHPTNADVVFVGSINGGIWRTDNANDPNPTWVAKTEDLPSLTIGAVEFDTDDSFFPNPAGLPFQTLVAGTGNFSSFGGEGGSIGNVYVSQDGGDTWVDPGSNGISGVRISGIASKEFASTIVISGDNDGIYRSTDGGANFDLITTGLDGFGFNDLFADLSTHDRLYTSSSTGIFRSDDFGLTWENISQSSPELQELLDGGDIVNTEIVVHPESGRLFVGIVQGGQPAGLFHTNSGDTATPTWVEMDVPILPIAPSIPITGATNTAPIEITADGHGLADGDLVLVNGVRATDLANGQWTVTVIDDDTLSLDLSDGTAAGEYVANSGQITPITNPSPTFKDTSIPGGQGRIHFSIGIDPNDEDIVYIGGDRQEAPFPNAIGATDFSASIFRGDIKIRRNPLVTPSPQWDHLTDDSNAFDPNGGTANGSAPHADSRDIAFDANGNLLEVNDGGVFRLSSPQDNTGTWVSINGSISVFEYHDVVYDTNSNVILAGSQDNGTQFQLSEGSLEWSLLSGGDGGDVVVDNITLADQNQSIRYSSFQNLGGFQSTVWDADNNRISSTARRLIVTEGEPFEATFDTSVVLNAVDPTRLLVGGSNGVYESSTQGDSAVQTSTFSVPGSVANPLAYGGRSEVNNDNPSVIYAGDTLGNVHVRTEAAGTYVTNINLGGGPIRDVRMNPNEWFEAIAIDSNTVVRTTDAGDTWDMITGNLSSIGASVFRSLEYVSQTVGTTLIEAVVLGTNTGVYAMTMDAVGTWFQLGSNLPNVPVFDMDYDLADDVLVLGTLGRGAWKLADASSFLEPSVTLSVDQTIIPEDGVSQAIVTANLSRAVNYETTINLTYSGTATLIASATNSPDYQTTADVSVVIPAGTTSGTFTLLSRNDDLDEDDETIIVDIDSIFIPALDDSGVAITNPVVELGEQQVTVTITDDPNDLPPNVTLVLAAASDTISEPDPDVAAGTTTVRAELSQVTSHDVTVTLLSGGDAVLNTDYALSADPISSQMLEIVIPAGMLFAEKTINVIDDSIDEFDESLTLTIDSATFATPTAGNQVDYTIIDDDAAPTVLLTATETIDESAGIGTYTATLSALSEKDVSVTLEIDVSSTATLVDDYAAPATLEITIPAGSLSGILTIDAEEDSLDEVDETVVMSVIDTVNADPVPVVATDHVATTTIIDDDLAPTVSLSFDSLVIPETGGQVDLQLTLSAPSSQEITVTLNTFGTATGGDVDYTGVPPTVTFLAGQVTALATVIAVDDAINESDETLIVAIDSVINADPGPTATATLTIEDDDVATPPELGDIAGFSFDEDELDAVNRTVALTGINAGNGENELIRVSATTSDPTLFANPAVTYASADSTGSLVIAPVADRYGSATVSVTVEKSGPDNNFATLDDNLSVTKTFVVTINPVNDTLSTTDKSFSTDEETPLRISASELIAGSLGDADPQAAAPQDESNQLFLITAINADGLLVNRDNAPEAPFATDHGQITEVNFDANGHLIDLVYLPNTNFNSVDPAAGSTQTLDSFGFTVIDDGRLIDADGGPDIRALPTSTNATASLFVAAINDQPTLALILDQFTVEDSGTQTVGLTGISAGGTEAQQLRVTATSSDTTLFGNPSVSFANGSSVGSITFTPLADRYGTGTITVTVEDAGLDRILSTVADNSSVSRTFDVIIEPVNDVPSATAKSFTTSEETSLTITAEALLAGSIADAVPSAAAPQDESNQTLGIVAIDAGVIPLTAANVASTVFPVDTTHGKIDAISFDANDRLIDLVYTPGTDFVSEDLDGNTVLDSFGFTVADDGLVIPAIDGPDLQLAPQLASEVASILVTPINDEPTLTEIADLEIQEDSPQQTIVLSGIAAGGGEQQDLRITATSSDATLFADPIVTYTLGDAVGTIDFTPVADRYGTSTVTVAIEDAGLDNDFDTTDDNVSSSRTFVVTLTPQNDVPDTTDKSFETGEDLSLTISAAELVADSVGDADPLALSPQDESNQLFRITSIETDSGSVTFANADSGSLVTTHGQIDSVRFDSEGFLIDLVYTPAAEFNSTEFNSAESDSESIDPVLDTFQFTLQDDGLAISPIGGPDIVTPPESVLGSASILVTATNDQPEINDIADAVIDEGSGEQTVVLDGINSGGGGIETQVLRITATSNNPTLIEDPTVTYAQGDTEATLRFTPEPNQFGSATITVTLTDGGPDNNLATASDNASIVKTFDVTVQSVNASPSFAPLFARRLNEGGPAQVVSLTAIDAGANEVQEMFISAQSDNPTLIADPTISYDGIGSTGTLSFVPLPNQFGSATITVTLTDSGDDNDLSTADDNASFDRTFVIEVLPIDDPPTISPIDDFVINENSAEVTIDLNGISSGVNESQDIRVTAVSSDTTLIADPIVSYVSPAAQGQLFLTPVADQIGSATITVTVEDGGEDGDLETTLDNQTTSETFTVNVADVNSIPIARNDTVISRRNTNSTSILPLLNDEDSDGTLDASSFAITDAPDFGTITQQTNQSGQLELIFTPLDSFLGSDSFEYTISDDAGATSLPATVQIVPDVSPVVGDDFGGGVAADDINIDVLSNDVAVSGQLDLATLTIVEEPTNGTTTIEADGTITYVPSDGYVGPDSFTYTITDTDGNVSAPVTVNMNLVASGLNNPRNRFDVNASGEVTALDALLILNRIQLSGSTEIPVDPAERGPNFFDVNDNQTISSLDAFLVIGEIEGNDPRFESESVAASAAVVIAPNSIESVDDEKTETVADSVSPQTTVSRSKLADDDLPSDHPTDEGIVSLLANDSTRNDSEVEDIEALTDLAIASLV
ncbi:Calx-beta domain protein [Rubripirellula obstinata]|uniref:Calx-beta domain protein n=1 Tax=Rubripirellula obstinata TaxID=406547 RepID=A0A5B1CCW0_9BACT|nr:Ig-like domain-containing protein [Rubripirellula obstinata]KAA1258967.1 Calx-beta domain protein [Rubripirellula obstinata]